MDMRPQIDPCSSLEFPPDYRRYLLEASDVVDCLSDVHRSHDCGVNQIVEMTRPGQLPEAGAQLDDRIDRVTPTVIRVMESRPNWSGSRWTRATYLRVGQD